MKKNLIIKTLSSLAIIGTCLIGSITPAFAADGNWNDCGERFRGAGTWRHYWGYTFQDGTQAHDNWYYIDGYWYYFKYYTLAYGEQQINGKWYFFDNDTGQLQTNKYVSVAKNSLVWADENGVLQYN